VSEILGERWQGTVPVIRVLSIVGVIGAIFDATAPVLQALGRPRGVTLMYGIRSLLILALVWSLAERFGLAGAAAAWLVAEVGVQITASILVRHLLPRPFEGLLRPVVALAVAAVTAGLAAWAIDAVLGGLPGLVISGLAGVSIAGLLLLALDRRLHLGILEILGAVYPEAARLLSRATRRGAPGRASRSSN
jgi:O-antigen/teichoic acid export membrane protein